MILSPFCVYSETINRDIVLEKVRSDCDALYFAESFQNDKEIVLEAVKFRGVSLRYASEALRNDKDIAMAAVRESGNSARRFIKSRKLQMDKDVIISGVKGKHWEFLEEFIYDKDIKDEEILNIVRWSVVEYGENLKYEICKDFRSDRDMVMNSVKQDGHNLQFVGEKFKNDKEVVIAAVSIGKNSRTLSFSGEEMKRDKEVVLAAVSKEENALRFACDSLKDDKEVVLAAVKNSGYALEFSSERMKDDEFVVLTAMKSNEYSICFASERLQNDKELLLPFIEKNGLFLRFCGTEIQNDRNLVMRGLEYPRHMKYLKKLESQTDNETRTELILIALKFLSEKEVHTFFQNYQNRKLLNSFEFLYSALQRNWKVVKYFTMSNYFHKMDLLTDMVRLGPDIAVSIIQRRFESKTCNLKPFIFECVKQNGKSVQYVSRDLSNNRKFFEQMVRANSECIRWWRNRDIADDEEFIIEILKNWEVLGQINGKDRSERISFLIQELFSDENEAKDDGIETMTVVLKLEKVEIKVFGVDSFWVSMPFLM